MLSCQNFSFQQPTVCGKELCCAKRCPRSWCCTSVPFAGGTWTVGQDSADTHQPVCNVGLWLKCDATRNGSRAPQSRAALHRDLAGFYLMSDCRSGG